MAGFGDNPWVKGLGANSNALIGLGAGLLSGKNFAQGLAMGGQGWMHGNTLDTQGWQADEERRKEEEGRNATVDWLRNSGDPKLTELATMVEGGAISGADAFKTAWQYQNQPGNNLMTVGGHLYDPANGQWISPPAGGGDDPASVREWQYFNSLTPEEQSAYLRMKRATPYLDVGTGYVQPDPVNPGTTTGPAIAKDSYTPAFEAASGTADAKDTAETRALYESMSSKLPGLQQVVGELGVLAEQATYTTAGKLWDDVVRETGQMPTEGALARTKYMAMVDNQILPLLRDTFGAQFTVQEGESLRATLGAPDKSPAEKRAVLEAFIEQKIRDVQALQSRLPGQSGVAADPLGIR